MASFASKVKANAAYKAAAKAQNLKPNQVKTRQAFQRVKAYAAGQKSASDKQSTNTGTGSAAITAYSPTTVGGNYVGSGQQLITDVLNKYGNNETIAGLGVGAIFDIGKTQANTGLAIAYNDAFLGSLGNYQSGQENLKTGNTMKLMAQEGAIARDLTDLQTGRALEGLKYGSDKQLEGAKYGYDSQERQIGLTGREERQTLQQKTTEEQKLRADARGAIRSQGARFYG